MRRQALALAALIVVAPAARGTQDSFPDLVIRELSAFEPGMSAEAWLRTHPADSMVSFVDSLTRDTRTWCVRAVAPFTLSNGRRATRIAYFFPPPPPADLALPTAPVGPALQRQGCRLGGIWMGMPGTAADTVLAGQLRSALTKSLGAEAPPPDSLFGRPIPERFRRYVLERGMDLRLGDTGLWGSASWRLVGVWRHDSVETLSAYDAETGGRAGGMIALSMAGRDHFAPDRSGSAEEAGTLRRDSARVAALLRIAGVDAPLAAGVRGLLGRALAWYGGRGEPSEPPRAASVLPVLHGLVTAARTFDVRRRSAALLAADMTLGAAGVGNIVSSDSDSTARRVLGDLGAQFVHSELRGGYNYTHSWLSAARDADPTGEVARLATILQLERGFNDNGMCGGGMEAFRTVTAVGESLLTHLPDSLAAEVHLLVARSYADVVELASNSDMGEYFDSPKYQREAMSARASAIAHYRRGLVLDPSSPLARASWREAWRLLAGLPPGTTHFACVYD